MYSIDVISIKDYFLLDDRSEYDMFIESIKPENRLCGKVCNMTNITFDEVEVIKKMLIDPSANDLAELFTEMYHIKGSQKESGKDIYYKESIFQLFRVLNHFRDWMEALLKKEIEWLSGEPSEALQMIGAGKRLAHVNHILTKIDIAEMFATTPDDIGKWKYGKVFGIMVALKLRNEIQKEINELK